jgi:ribosomal protein L12E/L44/L45/RPP1/RPP2
VFDHIGAEQATRLTLFTDSHVVRGTLRTRQRRLTDELNAPDAAFLVLHDAIFEDFGARAAVERADYVQVNLATILFAVADVEVEPTPELRLAKVPEKALVSVPPFKITGRIHLLPERSLDEALSELVERFVPMTDAIYWSDALAEARQPAPFLAVNHLRTHVIAPFKEQDVWAGMTVSAPTSEGFGMADEGTLAPSPDAAVGEGQEPV